MNVGKYVHDANRDGHKVRKDAHDQNGHHQSSLHVVCTFCSARRVERVIPRSVFIYRPCEAVWHQASGRPSPQRGRKPPSPLAAFAKATQAQQGLAVPLRVADEIMA